MSPGSFENVRGDEIMRWGLGAGQSRAGIHQQGYCDIGACGLLLSNSFGDGAGLLQSGSALSQVPAGFHRFLHGRGPGSEEIRRSVAH